MTDSVHTLHLQAAFLLAGQQFHSGVLSWFLQRLMRDFKRLQTDPPQGVNGSPNPENIMEWNAVIFGPEDTPWDGGTS